MAEGSNYPKLTTGEIDTDEIKKRFMGSQFIDWTRFAEAQGWDPHRSRITFPVATWQQEKKASIASAQADTLGALMFERNFKWQKEVLDTLENYPKAHDIALNLMNAKMNDYVILYNDYVQKMKDNKLEKDKKGRPIHAWTGINFLELMNMGRAIQALTDSKYKSLLLHDWTLKKAIEDNAEEFIQENEGKGPTFAIKGMGEVTTQEIQKMMDTWLDKPIDIEVEDVSK